MHEFGNVPRAAALSSLLNAVPGLAPIMALLWREDHTNIPAPLRRDAYQNFKVTQGVFQGECLSTAVFCVYLRTVVVDFLSRIIKLEVNGQQLHSKNVTILAYVDGVVLVCGNLARLACYPQ